MMEDKKPSQLSRRSVLKSASLSGIGSVGVIGLTEPVAASSHCTRSRDIQRDRSYEWSLTSKGTNENSCSGPAVKHKVEMASGLLYYGTVKGPNDERWIHLFDAGSHAESFSRSDCYDDWTRVTEPRYGIYKQKSSFDNKLSSSTNLPVSNGSDVKSNPAIGASEDTTAQLDVAYAAMFAALDAVTAPWPVGSALSIAAALVDNDQNASGTDELVEYIWDFVDNDIKTPCATNNVYQEIRSAPNADDAVEFEQIQEVWSDDGVNTLYEATSFSVQMEDPYSSYSLSSSSSESSGQSEMFGHPDKGEFIKDSEGNDVQIVQSSKHTHSFSGVPEKKVSVQQLPPSVANHTNSESSVRYKKMPVNIIQTQISGKIKG